MEMMCLPDNGFPPSLEQFFFGYVQATQNIVYIVENHQFREHLSPAGLINELRERP